jgi:hypothetical protein
MGHAALRAEEGIKNRLVVQNVVAPAHLHANKPVIVSLEDQKESQIHTKQLHNAFGWH